MSAASFTLRPATQDDAPFLTEMLLEATNWDPDRKKVPLEQVLSDPDTAHYIAGWQRPDDLGVVALGPAGQPIGAIWLRLFREDDHGYGFVAPDVPELTLGVDTQWRGKGVGRALLEEIAQQAATAGFASLSLSVERANHAARLYAAVGYTVVESGRDSDTMLKNIT